MPSDDERFGGLKIKRTIITSEPFAAYEPLPTVQAERMSRNEEIYTALVTGLRDYVHKNGFQSVLFGMSGGIDSTLVAAIAVDALGPENVNGISNPSAWSCEHSKSDAADMAERTGLSLDTIPIAPIFDSYQEALHLDGLAEENLQARIRAVIWMGLSNQHGHLVLACGNKSELATGYSTIYGDAVGAYAPIKDVPKTLVWELATLAQRGRRRARRDPADPAQTRSASRRRPSCVPASSTRTRCRRTTCSTRCWTHTSSVTSAPRP